MVAEVDLHLLLEDVGLLEEAGGDLLLIEAACLLVLDASGGLPLVEAADTCLDDDIFLEMRQSSLGFFLFSPIFEDIFFVFLCYFLLKCPQKTQHSFSFSLHLSRTPLSLYYKMFFFLLTLLSVYLSVEFLVLPAQPFFLQILRLHLFPGIYHLCCTPHQIFVAFLY